MRFRYEVSVKADSRDEADDVIARVIFSTPEMGRLAQRVGADDDDDA